MSKIGDLFVRLGLKKDDFSKGLKDAQKESTTFSNILKSLGKVGKIAFGSVAAAVSAVVVAIKGLENQNQRIYDSWNRMTAGMAASWDAFKTAIASVDFSHLLSNMREANRLARELYDAQDALGEIGTSYNISLSKQRETINNLRIQLQDATLSDEKRIEAGNKLLKIYQDLEKNPTRGLGNVSDKTLDQMAKKLGYNLKGATAESLNATRQQVENFFIWLGSETGESWNKAYSNASNAFQTQLVDFQARQAKLPETYQTLLKNYISKVGDKDRAKMEQAVTAYYEQQAKYSGETLRIQRQINSLKAKTTEDTPTPAPTSTASTRDTQAEAAARILQRAEDSAKSEIQLMYEKYSEEKALLEQYNLDTTALTSEYFRNIGKLIESGLDEIKNPLEDIEPIEVDLIDMSTSEYLLDEFIDDFDEQVKKAREITQEFRQAVIEGFSSSCEELMGQLMGLRDFNPGAIVQALITPLADLAIKTGEILISEGLGVEACKEALKSLNGYAAITAGAALVAIGAAAKAGLAALAKGGSATTTASTYGGSTSGGASTQNIETEMTIYVEGRISGNDIVVSGQKTLNSWNR